MNILRRLRIAAFAAMVASVVLLSTRAVSADVTCHEFFLVTFTHDQPWYEGACNDRDGMEQMAQLMCMICDYGNFSMILSCDEQPVGELFVACTGN